MLKFSEKSSQRIILILLVVAVLFWGAVGVYYFLSVKSTKSQKPVSSTEEESISIFKKADIAGYKITKIEPNDEIGRTVFYDWRGEKALGGMGEVEVQNDDSTVFTRHITGTFSGWEDIPDSSDKYLLLNHPETNSSLPKIRILFAPNQNLPVWANITRFGIEVLDYGPNNSSDEDDIFYNFGDIAKLPMATLEKLIKKGDALGCFIYFDVDSAGKRINLFDENGQLVAMDLLIRRFGGKEQVDKELK